MPFLILTRSGFDDIAPRTGFSGTTLYLNPELLSTQEIARLRNAGAEVHIFPSTVNPHATQEVQDAILLVEKEGGGPVWVERASPVAHESLPAVSKAQDNPAIGQAHKRLHHRLARTAGTLAGQALRNLGKRISLGKQLVIVPYLGYGNAHRLSVRGRVLEDEGFSTQSREDSRWRNLVELYKRLESDEVADARVRARFQGVEQETTSDRGGYFSFEIVPAVPLSGSGWHTVELELAAPLHPGGNPVRATAEVLVPPSTARFGVISDIDDTVLWTNVTNKLNMMLMLAHSNAHTRKPFKGVAAFYRALHEGAGGNENNPIFYVSSSPWHLFAPLVEFLRVQDIPVGPLMLKELNVRQIFGSKLHHTHKLDKIENILRFYPNLQFILIGDSGEQDPEIYAEVVKRHPQAVRAIYIRNVNPDPSRIEELDRLIEEVRATGAQLVLAPDSVSAAAHAAGEGLIRVDGMAEVRSDKKKDDAGTQAGI
jgi:phosphatidate phosphatase APP1